MRESIEKILAADFLIVNSDRHFNNFGAVRNADTLEWIGASPIFDCGTSMWYDETAQNIRPHFNLPSKPFKSNHSEQIKLVNNFEWIDFSALKNIKEEFLDIYKISKYEDIKRKGNGNNHKISTNRSWGQYCNSGCQEDQILFACFPF